MAGLLFLALAYFAVGQAAATRNGAQGAADAAALAAAHDARQQLGDALLESLDDPDEWEDLLLGRQFTTASACAEAQKFAGKNDSDSEGCERLGWPRRGFKIDAKTRYAVGDSVIPGTEGKYATATATAVIEPRCSLDLAESSENDDAAPIELTCKGEELTVDPQDPDPLPKLDRLFTVRLTD